MFSIFSSSRGDSNGGRQAALDRAREKMVRDQLEQRGIRDPRVLDAMREVPREQFLNRQLRPELVYEDGAQIIDCGQTISQPYIVALMTDALNLSGSERVLEIGTGSGYQTALLARLAGEVVSIERHEALSRQAGQRLQALGLDKNVALVVGDGTEGCPEHAPYDRILVAAAAGEIPEPLWNQLAEGGILVGPFGPEGHQTLSTYHKIGSQQQKKPLCPVRFVPLIADAQQ